ncbi:MAG: NAD(P)/FAD-dependent oxidoreductase [Salibacteraceae bacterium]
MDALIPRPDGERIVVIGSGFAGLRFCRRLSGSQFQVVLIDRHNYHQFQPLLYQVATAGLAPSAIAFPTRKLFRKSPNVYFRMAEVAQISPSKNEVLTSVGSIHYDHLVIATGATNNFFGNTDIERNALTMKSVEEALWLRNLLLENFEKALTTEDPEMKHSLLNVVIVGGGPTGVELAGALAEMKNYVLPKDYPEIDFDQMKITLVEASPHLLSGMSKQSSDAARGFLKDLGVDVLLNSQVTGYDGNKAIIEGKTPMVTKNLIWAAGIKANSPEGLPKDVLGKSGRLNTDGFHRIEGFSNIYAIGDVALMKCDDFPNGHPQVAQVAIQMADNLARNLVSGKLEAFSYKELGYMATVGRSKAVVDFSRFHLQGFIAWILWLFVHLMQILGVKNKFFIFIDWMWYYLTFDQSLRLVIKQKPNP